MHAIEWIPDTPLDVARSTARYLRWGADPVNVVTGEAYHRIVDGVTRYRVRQSDDGSIRIDVWGDAELAAADYRHRFAEHLPRPGPPALANRTVASQFASLPGYRPPLVADPFEALITAITAQQVNLRWATTTRRRLVEAVGTRYVIDGVNVWGFPDPAAIAGMDPAELRALQFTMRKSEYIVGVAAAATDGHLDGLAGLADAAVIERVTALRGIGRWSADWLLARCLGRGHVVAAGDLGVRKAISRYVLGREEVADEEAVRFAVEAWGDGANWATHLLLEKLAGG